MKKIFYNKGKDWRIGWKIVFCFLIYCVLSILSILIAGVLYQNVHISSFNDMVSKTMGSNVGYALQSVISILLMYLVYNKLIKCGCLSKSDLGIDGTLNTKIKMSTAGFLFGFVYKCLEIVFLLLFGDARITFVPLSFNGMKILLLGVVIFAGVAFTEEITFRGYMQFQLGKHNELCGVILSSLIFAAGHLINSNYTPLSLIYLIIGGLIFSFMRLVTNSIWFPIGFHLACNWAELSVFGLLQSGNKNWLFTDYSQNTVMNGGESGSGLIQIFILLSILAGLICCYGKKKQKSNYKIEGRELT